MGPVFTAGIISEIGQIDRFSDETKIAKYAGLYWRKHQSGRFTADDTSLSRNGNQYLRYYLVEAANSVRMQIQIGRASCRARAAITAAGVSVNRNGEDR